MKSESKLIEGLMETEARMLTRAAAYNGTLYNSALVKFMAAVTDFNVYSKMVMDPTSRPLYMKKMAAASSSLLKSAKLITDAFRRQGFPSLDFAALAEFLQQRSREATPFNTSDSTNLLMKVFPGMSEEMRTKVLKSTAAAFASIQPCGRNPLSDECNRAVFEQYGLRFLAGAEEVKDVLEDEDEDTSSASALLQVGGEATTKCCLGGLALMLGCSWKYFTNCGFPCCALVARINTRNALFLTGVQEAFRMMMAVPVVFSVIALFLFPIFAAIILADLALSGAFLVGAFMPGVALMLVIHGTGMFLGVSAQAYLALKGGLGFGAKSTAEKPAPSGVLPPVVILPDD